MAEEAKKDDAADAPPAKAGKRGMMLVVLPLAGLLLGGGGVAGYFLFLAPPPAVPGAVEVVEEAPPPPPHTPVFVKLERLSAPLIGDKRALLGYVGLDLQLEVDGEEVAQRVEDNLPIVRHAVNMALSERGAGRADNPRMIDYAGIAATVKDAANTALHEPLIIAVQIQSAAPR